MGRVWPVKGGYPVPSSLDGPGERLIESPSLREAGTRPVRARPGFSAGTGTSGLPGVNLIEYYHAALVWDAPHAKRRSLMFKRSERGAVHILFLIFVLVIALAFGALWFVQLQKNSDLETEASQAGYDYLEQEKIALFRKEFYEEIAVMVGGGVPTAMPAPEDYDTENAQSVAETYVNGLKGILADIGAQIDDGSATPGTVSDAISPCILRYQAVKGETAQKNTEIERLKNEAAAKDARMASDQQAFQKQVQDLQEGHESTRANMDTQLNELRSQNDAISQQLRDTQQQGEMEREKFNDEKKTIADDKEDLEGRVRQMHGELRIKRATQTPDGKVLSYDPTTGKAFIDIGSSDMLRRGTRFRVYEVGKGGVRTAKCWLTVTNTGPNMSECHVDSGGAPDANDILINPVFDKGDTVRFVMLGELTGRYNRETAARILGKLGAKVEDSVNIRTDFLVLGMKESEDEDDIEDRDDYKNAQRWGVEMIRARDLQPFLQL